MTRVNVRGGVHVGPDVPESLKPCLAEWVRYNEDYCDLVNKGVTAPEKRDAPWWYNEWASVSTFSAAVIRAGGMALEEYSERKGADGTKRGDSGQGRVDLWFHIDGDKYIAEAKQHWFGVTEVRWTRFASKCNGSLDDAEEQVLKYRCYDEMPLAMAFVVQQVYTDEDEDETGLMEQLVDVACSENVNTAAVAWSFAMLDRMPVSGESQYPGVFLFLRLAQKRRRG